MGQASKFFSDKSIPLALRVPGEENSITDLMNNNGVGRAAPGLAWVC